MPITGADLISIRHGAGAPWRIRKSRAAASRRQTGNRRRRLRRAFPNLDQLDIKAQRLQLANQHVERLRHAGLDGGFALDDGLVNLGAAINVIGLRRQQLLQNVGRAVSFQRPHFHFAEALTAELRLAAQRLLGDQRVRSDRPRVDLVVHQVRELQHVDVANRDRLLEAVAGHAVVKSTSCRKSAGPNAPAAP